jgi:3-deoxy-D-manno-octulosonic-acid transferase
MLPGRLGFAACTPPDAARPLLLHGVSVGEVKALRPLVALLRERRPGLAIAISSTTPAGLATARSAYPDLAVHAYPVDLPGATRRFLARVRPCAVVLAELEIWPNFLRNCHARGIPVAIVNGRITDSSIRGYRRVQRWLPRFDRIALYGVQNERYASGFRALEVPHERVVVTGNLKYDNLPTAAEDAAFRASPWARWSAAAPLVVFASTHEPEELELTRAWARSAQRERAVAVVVPRHPQRSERLAEALARAHPGRLLRRSALRGDEPLAPGDLLLVDTFGELESVFRGARGAFLGGSLIAHGGQNVLEPAALGVPVVTGPHVQNFREEVELLESAGGLRRAAGADEVIRCLESWLADPAAAARQGRAAAGALASRRGAAQSTFAALERVGIVGPSESA